MSKEIEEIKKRWLSEDIVLRRPFQETIDIPILFSHISTLEKRVKDLEDGINNFDSEIYNEHAISTVNSDSLTKLCKILVKK